MNYVGIIIVGCVVGFIGARLMAERLMDIVMNMAVGIVGAILGAYLVILGKPPLDPLQAQIFCAIGGAIVAVLGGNFAFRLIHPRGDSLNQTVFREELRKPR